MKKYHNWLLEYGWNFSQYAHVYFYRDPEYTLSTYSYADAIAIQHFRLTIKKKERERMLLTEIDMPCECDNCGTIFQFGTGTIVYNKEHEPEFLCSKCYQESEERALTV